MKKQLFTIGFMSLSLIPFFGEASPYAYHQYINTYSNNYTSPYRTFTPSYTTNTRQVTNRNRTNYLSNYYRNQSNNIYNQYPNYTNQTSKKRYYSPYAITRNSTNRYTNYSNRIYTSPYTNTASSISTRSTNQSILRVTPNATQFNNTNDLSEGTIKIFDLGLRHDIASRSSDFVEAITVSSIEFNIEENRGAVSDLRDYELIIDDEAYTFDAAGRLNIQFNNNKLRLSRGDSTSLPVYLRFADPTDVPFLPGSVRVGVRNVTASKELSGAPVSAQISGNSSSQSVVYNPRIGSSASGSTSVSNVTISGQNLSGGQESYVLSLRLTATADDFLLQELTVRNDFGNNVDDLIEQARLIDIETGRILDTTRFVNGVANFNISNNNQLYIQRNDRARVAIEVVVNDNFSTPSENRLKLSLTGNDIEIYGIGAGADVPDSRKNISIDSDTFTITRGGGGGYGGITFSSNQPQLISTGRLNETARFQVTNGSSSEISLGRFTIEAIPAGIEFADGSLSPDDFELKRYFQGRATDINNFTTSIVGSNQIRFDTDQEIYIGPRETAEFVIMAKLDNTGSNDDGDYITIKLLGDTSAVNGSFSSVKNTNSNFLWSDHSGRPHTPSSTDWYNANLFDSLPSNTYVNRRD